MHAFHASSRCVSTFLYLAGMRLLVTSLLRSIPALLNVVALLLFVFAIFGILGLQLWSGLFHARCRLTDVPVRFVGQAALGDCASPNSAECSALLYNTTAMEQPEFLVIDGSASLQYSSWLNQGLLEACRPGVAVDDRSLSKDDSPWADESNCFWPADPEDESLCTIDTGGQWECPNAAGARWCGSNFDVTGNERFSSNTVMKSSTFYESLNYGFIVFDNIGLGLLAIFQSITLEGWTVIMYQTMDVYTPFVGGLYFIILIMFGSFFLLNLTLAVIWENFSKGQEEQKAANSEKSDKARRMREEARAHLRKFRDRAQRMEDMQRGSVSPQSKAQPLHDDTSPSPIGAQAGGGGGWRLNSPPPVSNNTPATTPSVSGAAASLNAVGFASGNVSDIDAQAGSAPLAMIGASSTDPDRNARGARNLPSAHSSRESDTAPPHAGVVAPQTATAAAAADACSAHPTTAPQSTSHTPTNPPGSNGSPLPGMPHESPPPAAAGAAGGSMGGASTPELAAQALMRDSPTMSHGLRTKMEAGNRKTPPKSYDGSSSVRSGTQPDSGEKPPQLTDQRLDEDTKSARRPPPRTSSNESTGIPASFSMRSQLSARDLEEAQVRLQALKLARRNAKQSTRHLRTPDASSSRTLTKQASARAFESSETFSSAVPVDSAVKRYGAWVMNRSIPPEVRLAEVRRREIWLSASSWRRSVHDLVRDDLFTGSITVLILINTFVLAADRYPIKSSEADSLEIVNFICTLLFAAEMILKLIGLGPAEYVRDGFNIFDALIVIMSFVELAVSPPAFFGTDDVAGGAGGGISALRTFRLFRVFKLAASWPSLKNLLNTILKTVKDIGNFGILLLLFIYIFALVGMQFFANQMCYEQDTGFASSAAGTGSCPDEFDRPRANFDHLSNAIATVFMVLTGENWNAVMYDAWRSIGGGAVVYFILLVVIGNFIVLNLFLAILLGNFEGIDLSGNVENDPVHHMKQQGPGALKKRNLSRRISRLVRRASEREGTTVGWAAHERQRAEEGVQSSQSQRIANALDDTPYYEDLPCHRRACALFSGHVHRRGPASDGGTIVPHGARVMPLGNTQRSADSSPGSEGGATPQAAQDILPSGDSASDLRRLRSVDGGMAPSNPLNQNSVRANLHTASGAQSSESAVLTPSNSGLSRANSAARGLGSMGTVQESSSLSRQGSSRQGAAVGGNRAARRKRNTAKLKNRRASVMNTLQGALGIAAKPPARSKRASMITPPTPEVPPERMQSNSLCCMPPDNAFRSSVFAITSHPVFDRLVLLLILVSSVTLAIDNPLHDPDGATARAVFVIDIMLTVLFTIEMMLKIIALGLVMHKESYLRSGWNVLDGTIVIISIISLAMEGNSALSSLRALRALRALRPLRVVSRRPGLRLVVNALIGSMKSIFNVLLVVIMMFLIFGILAVNYFKGSFHACAGDTFDGLAADMQGLITYPLSWADMPPSYKPVFNASDSAHTSTQAAFGIPDSATPEAFLPQYTSTYLMHPPVSKQLCGALGASWGPALESRFDNVFQAIGTLFEMSTTEGWADVMWQGVDARGIEMQPVRDNQPGWVWFFMFFMVVGSFFAVNLFVGVVIDNFNQMKAKQGGSILLTDEQKEWVKTQEAMMKLQPFVQPPRATNAAMAWCQKVVGHRAFELTIVACIMLNTLTMAMEYFGASQQYALALLVCNYVFAVVFLFEAVVKLIALRAVYFKSSWNRFDFVVVLASIVGVIVQFTTSVDIGSAATVIRTFRVLRVLRLVKKARRLNQLFKTLLLTLPSLGNIGGLMFLLIFIYAVMGVQLFAGVQYGDFIDRHANFQSFGTALLVLIRASTGESWNGIMYEAANEEDCVNLDALPYDEKKSMCGYSNDLATCEPITGCGSPLAFIYFFSFTVFVSFVFLNLLIAVVIEGFAETDDSGMRLSDENFDHFRDGWVAHDPRGSGIVPSGAVYKLLQELPEPLGFGNYHATQKELQARLNQLKLKVSSDGHVRFHDMGQALAKRVFEESLREQGKKFEVPEHLEWDSEDEEMGEWSLEHFLAASRISRFVARIVLQRRALRALAEEHNITQEEARRLLEEPSNENEDEDEEMPEPAGAPPVTRRSLSRHQRRSLAMAVQGGKISLSNPFSTSMRRIPSDTEPARPLQESTDVDTDVTAPAIANAGAPLRPHPVHAGDTRGQAPAPPARPQPPSDSRASSPGSALRTHLSPLPSIGNTPAVSPLPSRAHSASDGSSSHHSMSHSRLPALERNSRS